MVTFYKNGSEETCVSGLKSIFETLTVNECVSASISNKRYSNGGGVSHACIMSIYNHLDGSRIWRNQEPWVTEVEYTIPHPRGDVLAFDTKSEREATLSSKTVVFTATATTDDYNVSLTRSLRSDYNDMDLNTERYSWVKIMKTKRYFYETDRSSWVFRLEVQWEGESKEHAKSNQKKYFVSVETNNNAKASANPKYSLASLLEKVLDIVSHEGGQRQVLTFR